VYADLTWRSAGQVRSSGRSERLGVGVQFLGRPGRRSAGAITSPSWPRPLKGFLAF